MLNSTFKVYEKPDNCCVCFESLNKTNQSLECGHWVHIECIKQQRDVVAKCPLCRQVLNIQLKNPKIISTINLIEYEEDNDEDDDEKVVNFEFGFSTSSPSHLLSEESRNALLNVLRENAINSTTEFHRIISRQGYSCLCNESEEYEESEEESEENDTVEYGDFSIRF